MQLHNHTRVIELGSRVTPSWVSMSLSSHEVLALCVVQVFLESENRSSVHSPGLQSAQDVRISGSSGRLLLEVF